MRQGQDRPYASEPTRLMVMRILVERGMSPLTLADDSIASGELTKDAQLVLLYTLLVIATEVAEEAMAAAMPLTSVN